MGKPTVAVYAIPECYPDGTIAFAHDHALAVMEDGVLKDYLHLERLTRIKRDNSMHHHLYDLLKEAGLLKVAFDLISVDSVQGRSFITSDGRIRVEAGLCSSLSSHAGDAWCWFLDKPKEAFVLSHELAHIYSNLPFYGDFKENSLLVHFDGGASKSNFSAWLFKNGRVEPIEYHWKFKDLSALFNANALTFSLIHAGFADQHSVPGKFMGFAGFGSYDKNIEAFLIKHGFFQDKWGAPSFFLDEANKAFGTKLTHYDQHNDFLQSVAATMHEFWVRNLLGALQSLKKRTGAEVLCFSGGSALNIVANTRIVDSNLFKTLYIPPCTDDSGLALGAAAYLEMKKGNRVKPVSPYINNWGIKAYKAVTDALSIREVASVLADGKIVGVCNGAGECGPRALGNRSILARADSKQLAQKVSCEIKKREWYRPVAPVMLADNVHYFTGNTPHPLTRFMLLDVKILPHRMSEIEGAVHVDGTSRIQALFDPSDNEWLHALLLELKTNYGINALINTSFNRQGEPIVHTEEDALKSAKEMGLHGVVLNGKWVDLTSD